MNLGEILSNPTHVPQGPFSYTPFTSKDTETEGPRPLPGRLLGPEPCILLPAPHWTQPGLGKDWNAKGRAAWISQSELFQGQKKGTRVGVEMGLAGHGGGDRLFAGQ